ncbi:hypothetical protein BGZ49_003667, partial [Haplosporangium sp. Z 27]
HLHIPVSSTDSLTAGSILMDYPNVDPLVVAYHELAEKCSSSYITELSEDEKRMISQFVVKYGPGDAFDREYVKLRRYLSSHKIPYHVMAAFNLQFMMGQYTVPSEDIPFEDKHLVINGALLSLFSPYNKNKQMIIDYLRRSGLIDVDKLIDTKYFADSK